MPTPANAINATTSGILGSSSTGFSGSSLTQYNTLVGGATTDLISNVAPQASGKLLQSGGAGANPSFSTGTYPSTGTTAGKILRSNGTNWVASTAQYPNSASTSGKAIISDGTNFVMSTPTFPNTSATSRKIIVSDGTNWVASTETYATPGTTGNVMTSDGTNWFSGSSPKLKTVNVTVSNADIKAGNSVLLLAAQGAGTVIMPTSFLFKMVYGGSNAFTNNPNCNVNWGSSSAAGGMITSGAWTAFWTATTSRYLGPNRTSVSFPVSTIENMGAYVTFTTGATGNAANDNTLVAQMFYYIIGL